MTPLFHRALLSHSDVARSHLLREASAFWSMVVRQMLPKSYVSALSTQHQLHFHPELRLDLAEVKIENPWETW